MTQCAMTIDVEDWFQVGGYQRIIDRQDWPKFDLRVERNTQRLLNIFDLAGVRATFFILGWIARQCPQLVRLVAAQGHEIASHGCLHDRVDDLGPSGFANDVAQAKMILEDISGQVVTGYRAPNFSISARTPWAHEILAEAGYRYSSSVVPVQHDHYGWPGSPVGPWQPAHADGLIELPVASARIFTWRMACGGGGFFRFYPYWLWRAMFARAIREQGSAIFYLHPWELDTGQPIPKGATWLEAGRHRVGLARVEPRLRTLLKDFKWGRLDASPALRNSAIA